MAEIGETGHLAGDDVKVIRVEPLVVSAAGALNGVILATARIPFIMSRDGLLFAKLDQLTDMSVFAYWVFYALAASSVFVLRRRLPNAPRPYRTFGYPLVPGLFVLTALWLLSNTLQTSPVEAAMGLLLISLGLPVFFFYRSRREPRSGPVTT